MPKRGERQPWRVNYQWSNGVRGTTTKGSEDEALSFAEGIHSAAVTRALTVTVTIENRDTGTSYIVRPTAIYVEYDA